MKKEHHQKPNNNWYEGALEYLFDNNYVYIFKYVSMISMDYELAKDITQETFAKAIMSISQLRDKTKFLPWIRKIAYNTCMDYLKKKNKYDGQSASLSDEESAAVDDYLTADHSGLPENIVLTKELSEKIDECLKFLNTNERNLIYLRYYDDCKYYEIAEMLNISEPSARMQLMRAKRKLLNLFNKLRVLEDYNG